MTYRLGVDLGTSFTAAAVIESGRAEIVQLGDHAPQVPSAIYRTASDAFLVGEAAMRAGLMDPARLAKEFKRRIGDDVNIIMGGAPMPPHLLMATLLRWVVTTVSDARGAAPDSVTVTHPANWGAYRRELMDQATAEAGVESAALFTEPEAAGIHFASVNRVTPGRHIAVYDLGGGTFDAAVLRCLEDGSFEIVGTPQGIEHLGGIDFDDALFDHIRQIVDLTSADLGDPQVLMELTKLRKDCTDAKESLSSDSDIGLPVAVGSIRTIVRLNRGDFENALRPAVQQTVATLVRTVERAGIDVEDLEAVVLVGGSSRIPLVTEFIGQALGCPVRLSSHPKHCVALGAAMLADLDAQPAGSASPVPSVPSWGSAVPIATEPREPTVPPPFAASPPLPAAGRGRRSLIVAGALAAFLVGAGAIAVANRHGGGAGPAALRTVTTSSSPSPSSSSTSPPDKTVMSTVRATPLTNSQALDRLNSLRTSDASRVAAMLDGRWVAQLSSKADGITDPLQSTASGSHTFHWVDILQEQQTLRQNATFGANVVTLLSTQFGSASSWQGHPLYVSVADEHFSSAASVDNWCARTFPTLSTAEREGGCAARQLTPVDGSDTGAGSSGGGSGQPPDAAYAVSGHVRTSGGQPVSGYTVEFKHYPDCPGICQQIFTTSNGQGAYSLNLPNGYYVALCIGPLDSSVNCSAKADGTPLLVEIPPRGQVVNFTARPQ